MDAKEILQTIAKDGVGTGVSEVISAFVYLSRTCARCPDSRHEALGDPRLDMLLDSLKSLDFSQATPTQLANVVASLAIFGIKDADIMANWTEAAISAVGRFSAANVANVLLAVAKLEYRSEELLKGLATHISQKVHLNKTFCALYVAAFVNDASLA